jgi:hypothetical protein
MSGFIFKNVVVPGRLIYRIRKGIPSGSPFTSLIGTLTNWIGIRLVLNKSFHFNNLPGKDYHIAVCGDDTLIRLPERFKMDKPLEVYSKDFAEITGFFVKPDNFNFRFSDSIIEEFQPSFLKTFIFHNLPSRRFSALCESLSLPEESKNTIWQYWGFVSSYFQLPICNPKSRRLLVKYSEFISSKLINEGLVVGSVVDNKEFIIYPSHPFGSNLMSRTSICLHDSLPDSKVRKDTYSGDLSNSFRINLGLRRNLEQFGVINRPWNFFKHNYFKYSNST